MKKIIPIIILLSACVSFSQIGQDYSFFGTFTIPLSDFSKDDEFNSEGFSMVGFGAGIQHDLTLGHPSIILATDVYFLVNIFNKDEFENNYPLQAADDIKGGHYFNTPILTGLKISIPVSQQFALYGTGQVGCNIMKEIDLKYEVLNTKFIREFETNVIFAWGFGGGVIVNDHVSIGVRYINLGEPEVDYDITINNENPVSQEREFKVSLFQFMVGFFF